MVSLRKSDVVAKAHYVAIYRNIDRPQFVTEMLRMRAEHLLSSLEDIDREGKIWTNK